MYISPFPYSNVFCQQLEYASCSNQPNPICSPIYYNVAATVEDHIDSMRIPAMRGYMSFVCMYGMIVSSDGCRSCAKCEK